MLVLREHGNRVPRELPRGRLILAADAQRKARRGDVALRRRDKIDVEVMVEPRRTGKAVKIDSRRGDEARLHPRIDEPVRAGAEELSACKIMIDGLVEIIERGERADDDVVVPWLEIVAADNADAERIAGVDELVGDHVGRGKGFRRTYTAPVLGEFAADVAASDGGRGRGRWRARYADKVLTCRGVRCRIGI